MSTRTTQTQVQIDGPDTDTDTQVVAWLIGVVLALSGVWWLILSAFNF